MICRVIKALSDEVVRKTCQVDLIGWILRDNQAGHKQFVVNGLAVFIQNRQAA